MLRLISRGLEVDFSNVPPLASVTVTEKPFEKLVGGTTNQKSVQLVLLVPIWTGGSQTIEMVSVASSVIVTEGKPSWETEMLALPAIFSLLFPLSVTLLTEILSP